MKKRPFFLVMLLLTCCILFYMQYPLEQANTRQSLSPIPSTSPHQAKNEQIQFTEDSDFENKAEKFITVTEEPLPALQLKEHEWLQKEIDQLLQTLTLQQKIGQLLIIGIKDNGSKASQSTEKLIVEQGIGNIILFKRNIKSETQLEKLIQHLKQLPENDIPPLWISIDQEGGKVNRLPKQFPSSEQLAKHNDPAVTKQTGEEIGIALSELSIDINFAPVLDVNNNPENPVIGSRAFGSDADSVVIHGMAILDGMDDYVLAVGKHFPGHGDTNVDSHLSLPTIDKSWEELEQLELIPFRAAILQGIEAIMVGHLYLPQIDEQYPASLSPKIINYLRDVLDFSGLIITDDLIMGGITEHYDIGDAAVLALQAGNTMLIIGHEPQQQQKVIHALLEAVEQNVLDEAHIDEKVELVLKLKLKGR